MKVNYDAFKLTYSKVILKRWVPQDVYSFKGHTTRSIVLVACVFYLRALNAKWHQSLSDLEKKLFILFIYKVKYCTIA